MPIQPAIGLRNVRDAPASVRLYRLFLFGKPLHGSDVRDGSDDLSISEARVYGS